jgi:hypothetical protein
MVASHLLRETLSAKHVAQLAAVLEATVPFRTAVDNLDPLERLYQRLAECNEQYHLSLSEKEMVETIRQGADLLNRSVANMATTDIAVFLGHTWSLMPEQHASLRQSSLLTLPEYYQAVYSMTKRITDMDPDTIFLSFRGLPAEEELQQFKVQTARNLDMAALYLRTRLFSTAVVTAFACLTGGMDVPMCFCFGDLPSVNRDQTTRLGDGLESVDLPADDGEEEMTCCHQGRQIHREVYNVLRGNRMSETGFNSRNAPLAAYLYQELGNDMLMEALKKCSFPRMTEESSWELLRFLPRRIVCTVGEEVGKITVSRAAPIRRVLEKLDQMAVQKGEKEN